jgi:hypothetical protein
MDEEPMNTPHTYPDPTPESVARAKADGEATRAQLTRDTGLQFDAEGFVRVSKSDSMRILIDTLTLHRLVDTYGVERITRWALNMAKMTGDTQ